MEHNDILSNILILLDYDELMTLMHTNVQINHYLTNNNVFWIQKIQQDFSFVPPLHKPYYKTYKKLMDIRTKTKLLLMNNVYFNIDDCTQLDVILPNHIKNNIDTKECGLIMNLGLSYTNSLTNQFYPAFISYGDYDDIIEDDNVIEILMKLLYYYPNVQIFTH